MNSIFSFNKYKNIFVSFLATGFCPKNLAFTRKIMGLTESAPPGSYAYAHKLYSTARNLSTGYIFVANTLCFKKTFILLVFTITKSDVDQF